MVEYLSGGRIQGIKGDSLGSSADGSNSGITLVESPFLGSGLQFTGTGDYNRVDFANTNNWKFFHDDTTDWSMNFWVSFTNQSDVQNIFTNMGSSISNTGIQILFDPAGNGDNAIRVRLGNGTSSARANWTTSNDFIPAFDTRYMITITYDATSNVITIYRDGSNSENSGALSNSASTSNPHSGLRLGADNQDSTTWRMKGKFNQLLFYKKKLSTSEISALYNSGNGDTTPDTSDLYGWFKWDSNGTDTQGNNNATVDSGVSYQGSPKLGSGCYSFDGSNDKVETGDKFGFLTQTGSIAFWMKPTTFNDNDVLFDSCNASSGNNGVLCKVASASNLITFLIARGGSSSNLNYTFGSDPSGKWTHLAFTYDGTTAKIYENGSEVASGSVTSTTNTPTHNLHFGEAGSGQDGNYDGLFDDIGIWNRVLSATEISALVNAPNSWWIGGTSKNVTIDGNNVTTLSGSAWANWAQGKAVTAPTTLEFSVDDTNTNCIVGFGTGTGTDSPSAGSPMKHCAYLTSGGDIYWFDSTGEADTSSNRAAGDTYKLVWQSNGNLDLYLKPSGGSYGSSLKSWTSVTGTLYPMVQGYGGIVVTMLPTATVDGALVSSLSDTSGLKAYYNMDTSTDNVCPNNYISDDRDNIQNVPANTRLELTDVRKIYRRAAGTTPFFETDFGSDDWSHLGNQSANSGDSYSSTTISSNRLKVIATNSGQGDIAGATAVKDLGSALTDGNWVIRFTMKLASSGTLYGNSQVWFGLSDDNTYTSSQGTNNQNDDAAFFKWMVNDETLSAITYNGGSGGSGSNTGLTRSTAGSELFFEMKYDGTTLTIQRYTDSTYETTTGSATTRSGSNVTGLRYAVAGTEYGQYHGTFNVEFGSFKVYDNTTTVSTASWKERNTA